MPPTNPVYLDLTQPVATRVTDLLSYMTLEEKIGQMTLIEKNSITNLTDVSTYSLGGILSGSGAKPEINSAAGWREMIVKFRNEAMKSRLGIPLLYGSDAIHGHSHVPGMTIFPHAIGLGATQNTELIRSIANATAEDLTFTGVNWNFSPNLDMPQDIRWGRVYETFSDDPVLVAKFAVAYVQGLQNTDTPVLATLKHYIGMGGMEWDTSLNKNYKIDQGVTIANEKMFREVYLPPFIQAIDAGALSVMVGLNTWNDKKMVLQNHLITDVLKQELDFKGFVVSDWYGVHEGRANNFWATVQAANAGVDMFMLPFDYKSFARHMKWANRLGLISDERIDDAVGRILYAKFTLGLFDQKEQEIVLEDTRAPSHKALAREAVAQSLVLLKNDNATLLLSDKYQHIRVAGSAADNVGKQMGGWSIEWQGVDGNWPTESTSILAGIKERASDNVHIEYNLLGEFEANSKQADIGIAIVGERPYSEGWGDVDYPSLTKEDLEVIQKLQNTCDKVVIVLISGRPLFIENEIESFDALVAAWLPGSEGGGVADVLFGDKPFTGKLPIAWPAHVNQLPVSIEGETYDSTPLLFERYFGL